MHVHVVSGDGEAKFWLEPKIVLATNYHYSRRQLKEIESLVEVHPLPATQAGLSTSFTGLTFSLLQKSIATGFADPSYPAAMKRDQSPLASAQVLKSPTN